MPFPIQIDPKLSLYIILMLAWTLPWKGVALYKAAKNEQMVWFIVIFLLNTFAILEITYLFFFQKKKA